MNDKKTFLEKYPEFKGTFHELHNGYDGGWITVIPIVTVENRLNNHFIRKEDAETVTMTTLDGMERDEFISKKKVKDAIESVINHGNERELKIEKYLFKELGLAE